MPKIIDYPRASMKACFMLADAVNDLGGQCSAAMAADKLGKQSTSGAYKAMIGAAVKFNLVTNKKGQLKVTQQYRDIKLSYSQDEASARTQQAFLSAPLFLEIFKRFENKPLPLSHFEKLLIREFGVPDNYASRLTGYFVEGAKECGLLGEGNVLSRTSQTDVVSKVEDFDDELESDSKGDGARATEVGSDDDEFVVSIKPQSPVPSSKFSVRISGPGMDTLIDINEGEDLDIVRAMLKKIERKLSVTQENNA